MLVRAYGVICVKLLYKRKWIKSWKASTQKMLFRSLLVSVRFFMSALQSQNLLGIIPYIIALSVTFPRSHLYSDCLQRNTLKINCSLSSSLFTFIVFFLSKSLGLKFNLSSIIYCYSNKGFTLEGPVLFFLTGIIYLLMNWQ